MKFIREILTILAGLIVVALTAALAGPHFVDWNTHRAQVEARLSELTGTKVRIAGDIDLRILPAPRLVLENVSVGGEAGFAMSARRIEAELAAMPLLRGQLHFMVARIEAPDISISMSADGGFDLPAWPAGASGQVAFETIAIANGRLRIMNAQRAPVSSLEKIALEASAASLTGPWRGAGEGSSGAQRLPFYFNTGVREADRLRLKFVIDAAGEMPRSEFDGAVVFGSGVLPGAHFSLEGQAKVSGAFAPVVASADNRTQVKWEASGPFRADAKGMAIEPLELRAGGEERTFSATGLARHVFGEHFADVVLETPRIDLDYLAGARNRSGGMMSEFGDYLSALVAGGRSLLPLQLSLKSSAVTLGGELLTDVAMSLSRMDSRTANIRLSSGLPGRAGLTLGGTVETGAAAQFKGRAKFEARDIERFSQWLGFAFPDLGEKLAGLPFARFEFDGDVDVSAAALLARKVDIVADRSRFNGFISATRTVGGERARIVMDLTSPSLDIDGIPDLTPVTRAAADFDYAVSLDARAVRVARVGQGMIDAGRILLRLAQKNDDLQIEQFDIVGLGGASLSARGYAGAQKAELDVKLNADRLVDLASLLQRISPGVWSDALVRRAVALSPATLTFSAQGERHKDMLRLSRLTVDGSARGSRVTGAFTPGAADSNVISGKLTIANAQTPMLLRQLGFETVPLERLPDGRIEIEASGSLAKGFEARARAALAGTDIEWQGSAGALLPVANLRGPLRIASRDASPLLQILGLALPDASARAAVELRGDLDARDGRIVLSAISGQALGSSVAGMLAYGEMSGGSAPRIVSGDLRIDRLSLEGLAALIAGPRPPARANSVWSDFRFAAAVADPPPARIMVQASVLSLPAGVSGDSARFRLELGPGIAEMSDISMKLGEGGVRGRVSLRRDRANVSVGGEIYFDGPLPTIGDFSASVKSRLEFSGSGPSYAAIVASLAGRGNLDVSDLRIAAADVGALERVTAGTLDMLDITEAKIATLLSQEFARNSANFRNARFELALASGQLSLVRAADVGGPNLSIGFDLRRLAVDASLVFAAPAPEGWSGAPPEAAIRWQGAPTALRRSLNVGSLVNGLGARAIEREAARIEMLEFDARERAAFNRRARAVEFLQQREMEIAAFQQEQERRRIEEDARRKAQEAAAKRAEAEREKRERERAVPPPRPSAPAHSPAPAGPLQLTPQPAPVAPQAPVLNDPAAAGRY